MKLTDKQKKKIIADYIECENYSEVARKNNVSRTTIKNIVGSDKNACEKLQQKKEQNTLDMLTYMESRKETAQQLVDLYLLALQDPEKIQKAPLIQIATSFGIIIDKFTKTTGAGEESLLRLDGLLKEFTDAVKSETI